ncbi:MAG: ATP-binding protein [Saprospiraceae bacterium]
MIEQNKDSSSKFATEHSPELNAQVPYQILVEENEAGIFHLINDRITFANPAFLKIIDLPKEEVLGSSILETVDELDRKLLEEGLQALLQGKSQRFSQDLRLKTSSQTVSYFSLHLKVYQYKTREVRIIGASRIATSRVEKSIELDKMRRRYEALYHEILEGVFIYDYVEEKMVGHNAAALSILGFEHSEKFLALHRKELIPQYSKYFPGADLHEATKDHGRRVVKGEAFYSQGIFNGNQGKQVLVNVSVVPTHYKKGEAFVIFTDTTQKVIDHKIKAEIEKKYRTIFENAHEAITYREANTRRAIICNERAFHIFGVKTLDEMHKIKPKDFCADPLIDGLTAEDYTNHKFQEAIDLGRTEVSFRLRKYTGEIIHVHGFLVGDRSDPEHPKVISFLRDVTHLFHARIALKEKNEELKKYISSNLQLENFAYFASHDLQTPLRSIISFTQLLMRKLAGKLSQEEQECMDFIISSSKNMRNLINDLLSYSRINTTDIKIVTVDLPKLLEQLFVELNSLITEQKATITLHDIPTTIQADPTKIHQLFQNLITNAIKFSKAEKVPEISISCSQQKEHWEFTVKDNGIGIDPAYQQKIFLLFKRLHGNTDYEGTGIGLAMVKKIVDQHGGDIRVESNLGKGSAFIFKIKM